LEGPPQGHLNTQEDPGHVGAPADLAVDPLERVRLQYESADV
jgi:hypothetical protein